MDKTFLNELNQIRKLAANYNKVYTNPHDTTTHEQYAAKVSTLETLIKTTLLGTKETSNTTTTENPDQNTTKSTDKNTNNNNKQGTGAKPNWIAIAERQIGIEELPGSEHNPQILVYHDGPEQVENIPGVDYNSDETAWCASFVGWVMQEAGVGGGFITAWAPSWAGFGKAADGPAYGAIGVTDGHVGFVVGGKGNNLFLLGGNQGNKVCISQYPVSDFVAFRFPSSYTIPPEAYNLSPTAGDIENNASTL